MRIAAAGLFLALAPTTVITTAPAAVACPVDPKGAWPQGAAIKAVTAGKQNVTVPRKWEGFNRSVSIEGFCADAFTVSSSFGCAISASEIRAASIKGPQGLGVNLRFGLASCNLTGMSIYKTTKASQSKFEAEMRFEFEGCQAAPVSSAAVVIGLRKDPVQDFNLAPWVEKVCPPASTTTGAPPVNVSFQASATEIRVGSGKCSATVRRKIPDIKSEEDCKLQCVSSTTQAHILGRTGCRGFAYNSKAKGENCITFSGNVVQAIPAAGWECYNLTYGSSSYAKATTPPPTIIKDTTAILQLQQVLAGARPESATMRQVSPPADSPSCFASMWWFTLEDGNGEPVSAPVKEADWDKLIGKLATPTEPTAVDGSPEILDRVLMETCSKSRGWSGTICPKAVYVVDRDPECRNSELTGAIVSGMITCALTWILVGAWFGMYVKFFSRRAGYQPAAGDESGQVGSRVCTHKTFQIGMILVAVGGACLSCWLSLQLLDATMRSTDCFDASEFLVVIIAVGLSVALAIIIFALYLANRHPGHSHPYLHEDQKAERKNTKLMLVEVPEGADVGHHLASMTSHSAGYAPSPFGTMRPGDSHSPNVTGGSMQH